MPSEKAIVIISGESSGELYGSLLARELGAMYPGIRMLGVGGQRMAEAGVEIVAGITHALGLTEVMAKYREIRRTFDRVVDTLRTVRPQVVVLIDYPDFNFKVAREARALGIRVLYYVSPQVWAWRAGRVREMATFVDRMAVILPFEKAIYDAEGVPCEFVGHPILEEMLPYTIDMAEAKKSLGLDPVKPYIALLPGSRPKELRSLLPVMLGAMRRFRADHPEYGFLVSVAPNLDRADFKDLLDVFEAEGAVLTSGNAALMYSASGAAVTASGTAAFQAVFRGTPLVVVYKLSRITHFLMSLIVKAKYINLMNIILGRESVLELTQDRANEDEVLAELERLLFDSVRRSAQLDDMRTVAAMFEGMSPSRRVAEIAGELGGYAR